MKLIAEPRASEIREEVKEWLDVTGWYSFSSYKSTATAAISEFLANREGLTFYGYMVNFTPPELRK